MKKLYLIVVVLCFLACAPHAHAASCTNTTYNNITCVQAIFVNTDYCEPSGFTINGFASVTSGDLLLMYVGMGGPQTSISLGGNLGTGSTWSTMSNQALKEWGPNTCSGDCTDITLYAYPTSSGTLNLTAYCSPNTDETEMVFMELRSSKGTVGIDCSSAWTTYVNSTGPYGQSQTPLCASSFTNDLYVSRLNSGPYQPAVCSGWTEVTEVTSDINLAVEAASSTTSSVSCPWGSDPAQDAIVGTIAFDDGSGPVFSYSPSPVAFGSVTVGQSGGPTTVTITNTGSTSLNLGTLSSNSSLYVISSDLCSSQDIAALGTCTFKVTFSPLVAGSQPSTITVPDNAGNPDTINMTGTGAVAASSKVTGIAGIKPRDLGIK